MNSSPQNRFLSLFIYFLPKLYVVVFFLNGTQLYITSQPPSHTTGHNYMIMFVLMDFWISLSVQM